MKNELFVGRIRICKECNGQIEIAGRTIDKKNIVLRCCSCGTCYLSKIKNV